MSNTKINNNDLSSPWASNSALSLRYLLARLFPVNSSQNFIKKKRYFIQKFLFLN